MRSHEVETRAIALMAMAMPANTDFVDIECEICGVNEKGYWACFSVYGWDVRVVISTRSKGGHNSILASAIGLYAFDCPPCARRLAQGDEALLRDSDVSRPPSGTSQGRDVFVERILVLRDRGCMPEA
jgi:hypothetical protein